MHRPNEEKWGYRQVAELWGIDDKTTTTVERMLGIRPKSSPKRPSLQQIRLLADEVGLPEAFFYADFSRLDEIVPEKIKALLEAQHAKLAAIELERQLLEELYPEEPDAEAIQQLVEKEVVRDDANERAAGRTKPARRRRRSEDS